MKTPNGASNDFLSAVSSDILRFRDVLMSAGYTEKKILEILGIKNLPAIKEDDLPILLRRTSHLSPLETLVRLFLVAVPVDLIAVERAIRPLGVETLIHAGIVGMEAGRAFGKVKLLPFQGLIFAFDQVRRLRSASKQDYVMGIGRSTLTLANLTVRKQVEKALDLGTGCGVHALLAARHSDHVVGTDINPRALNLAAFNAKINGISNLECLEGNLFQSLRGRKFDLIVSNPPFVISPESLYVYRDSGLQGDEICQRIARDAPKFLDEGGYCQVLCNWIEPSSGEWSERIRQWFKGTGCDVWVMRSETHDAETYASTWIRHTELGKERNVSELFEKWMAYYQEQDIRAIGAGLITMRRSSKRENWFKAEETPDNLLGPCGEHIELGFQLRDYLEDMEDDSRLLGTAFSPSPDAVLETHHSPASGMWEAVRSRLTLAKGLAYSGDVDPYIVKLIIGCNGRTRLIDLLHDVASSLEEDPATVAPALCNIARRLIERGFLLPAEIDD